VPTNEGVNEQQASSEFFALTSAQNQATASHRFRWRRVREARQGSACARCLLNRVFAGTPGKFQLAEFHGDNIGNDIKSAK
jgi:hypothetical protein